MGWNVLVSFCENLILVEMWFVLNAKLVCCFSLKWREKEILRVRRKRFVHGGRQAVSKFYVI